MPQKRNDDMVQLLSPDFVRRNEITRPVFLTTPLTSTAWDGDSYSTTPKTKIDLSAVFGAPAGIKAILVRTYIRDSGSASSTNNWLLLSPNDTAYQGMYSVFVSGLPNDTYSGSGGICSCDANGDIYYQISATGTGTMDITIEIWGYWL